MKEEEQNYWDNRPSVGYIFEETFKIIKKKDWQNIKLKYLIDHPNFDPNCFQLFYPIIHISNLTLLFPHSHNIRTKWKTVEQLSPNFKFPWKKTVDIFILNRKRMIAEDNSR
jgi:hypothetical protein